MCLIGLLALFMLPTFFRLMKLMLFLVDLLGGVRLQETSAPGGSLSRPPKRTLKMCDDYTFGQW